MACHFLFSNAQRVFSPQKNIVAKKLIWLMVFKSKFSPSPSVNHVSPLAIFTQVQTFLLDPCREIATTHLHKTRCHETIGKSADCEFEFEFELFV
jgi:hypothetical protein